MPIDEVFQGITREDLRSNRDRTDIVIQRSLEWILGTLSESDKGARLEYVLRMRAVANGLLDEAFEDWAEAMPAYDPISVDHVVAQFIQAIRHHYGVSPEALSMILNIAQQLVFASIGHIAVDAKQVSRGKRSQNNPLYGNRFLAGGNGKGSFG